MKRKIGLSKVELYESNFVRSTPIAEQYLLSAFTSILNFNFTLRVNLCTFGPKLAIFLVMVAFRNCFTVCSCS